MGGRLDIVIERIGDLLALPDEGRGAQCASGSNPSSPRATPKRSPLTAGGFGFERKIDQATAHLARGGDTRAEDLQKVLAQIEETEEELAQLRKLLGALRNRVAAAA